MKKTVTFLACALLTLSLVIVGTPVQADKFGLQDIPQIKNKSELNTIVETGQVWDKIMPYIDEFTKKTGVKVNVERVASPVVYSKENVELLVSPHMIPEEIVKAYRRSKEEEEKLLNHQGPEEVYEDLAPELRIKAGEGKDQPDGNDGADIVDAHVDQLNAFGQKVVPPIPLQVADDLGYCYDESEAYGESSHGCMKEPGEADGPLGPDIGKLDVHR